MIEQQYTNGQNGIVYEKIELPDLDRDIAVIDDDRLAALFEYSTSNPTGVYLHKMWKRMGSAGSWFVCEYVEHPTNPDKLRIHRRRAVSPETLGLIVEGVLWFIRFG